MIYYIKLITTNQLISLINSHYKGFTIHYTRNPKFAIPFSSINSAQSTLDNAVLPDSRAAYQIITEEQAIQYYIQNKKQ